MHIVQATSYHTAYSIRLLYEIAWRVFRYYFTNFGNSIKVQSFKSCFIFFYGRFFTCVHKKLSKWSRSKSYLNFESF